MTAEGAYLRLSRLMFFQLISRMFQLHLFDSAEHHYDCVCGVEAEPPLTFTSEHSAMTYLRSEFGECVYACTPQELAAARAELAA